MANANITRGMKWLTSTAGALLGYVSGDGSDTALWTKGTLANRPAASVYNIGAEYFADDENGGTLYRNYTGASWQKVSVGLSYATGVQLYIRDTLANVLAQTGSYVGQMAYASDHGLGAGLVLVWNGSAWKVAPWWQPLQLLRSNWTAPADTNDNPSPLDYTLPAIGANDMVRVCTFWTMTNNANSKTVNVNIGTSGSYAQGAAVDVVSNATGNLVTEMRNQASASSQEWFTNNKAVYGGTNGSLVSTGKDTGVAGKHVMVSLQKANGADSCVMNWGDIWICGGM